MCWVILEKIGYRIQRKERGKKQSRVGIGQASSEEDGSRVVEPGMVHLLDPHGPGKRRCINKTGSRTEHGSASFHPSTQEAEPGGIL